MEKCSLMEEICSTLKEGKRITRKKLLSIPSIKKNPISERLIDSFTRDGVLEFKDLIRELQHFVSASSLGPKLKLLFKIYDKSKQGKVSEGDLFHILKTINSNGLEDYKLWNIVDKTFGELGEYPSDMDLEEFSSLILGRTKNIPVLFKAKED